MDIDVKLCYENNDAITRELKKIPSTKDLIWSEYKGNTFVNVKSIALIEDLYGTIYKQNNSDEIFLKDFNYYDVFSDDDFMIDGDFEDDQPYIGKWNLNFLKWIKHIATTYTSTISITFQHERGDWLEEEACWIFDFTKSSTIKETFILINWFGVSKPIWEKKIIRDANGVIEKVNVIPNKI